MRYLFITISLFFLSFISTAQKRFEGTISFLMVSPDSNLQVSINAWYKKDKIKFITTIKKGPAMGDLKNETVLLNFKKGVIDRWKDDRKIIEREFMKGKGKKQDIPLMANTGTLSNILGHACAGYTSGQFSRKEKKDTAILTTSGEIKIWYANDLFFPVPHSYKMIQMVPLFSNGYLALGSDITIRQSGMNIVLHTEAKEIKSEESLQQSVFLSPKDYKLRHNK